MSSPAPPEEDPYASLFKSRQKTPPPAETPRSYRVRSEETWAAAREDYECGWSAEEVCRRYDLGLSAFRQRARREEWRRCDQPEPEPLPPFPAEPEAALSDEQLLDLAQRSLSSAVRRGRVYEARAWMRLIAELKQRARQAAESAAYRQRLAALKAKRAEEAEPEPQPADEDAPKNAHGPRRRDARPRRRPTRPHRSRGGGRRSRSARRIARIALGGWGAIRRRPQSLSSSGRRSRTRGPSKRDRRSCWVLGSTLRSARE